MPEGGGGGGEGVGAKAVGVGVGIGVGETVGLHQSLDNLRGDFGNFFFNLFNIDFSNNSE